MSKVKTYSFINVLALVALAFPMLVGMMKEDNKPNLVGLVISDDQPECNKQDWLDGSYQALADDYYSDHWAFKEKMVRLNNQFYYDVFNQVRVNGFVSGKDNYIFAESYIFSAFGDDLVKESQFVSLMDKARVVQDSLKAKGIDLILGLAPGKGRYCEEFIEDKYRHPVRERNHDVFTRLAAERKLNILDLYTMFQQMKGHEKYPLFPRFGHHWSYYGECLAVDTIIAYMEKLRHTDMPDLKWDEVEVVDTARSRDADVLKSMNLLKNPSQNMQLGYPKIYFEDDSLKNRTRVLTLGDSYWYGPVYMGVTQQAFGYGQFWYYYNRVVPQRVAGEKLEVWQLDLKAEVESYNVIMLMYADGNLPGYGNGFIEDLYEMYTSPATFKARMERKKQIQTYARQIREAPLLLKKATKKSNELQIPLDSAIKLDAMMMAGLR